MFELVPLIVFIPLLGALVNLFFGRRLSQPASGAVAVGAALGAFGVALSQWAALAANGYQAHTVTLADWIRLGDLHIPWAFQVDTLSVTMMLIVTGVGALIHTYATGYMHDDVHHQGDESRYPRFFAYFNLFLAAMLVLVTANNFAMMFVGWEGVGLCSFLLIGFWYEKGEGGVGNALAAIKAFVTNRVGDFGLLLAMFLIFWNSGSLIYAEVFEHVEAGHMESGVVTLITLLLALGVAGKSAQIPLYVWLPDAMAGPTPVSALIHAATMVTAGIYLMTRAHPLFELAPLTMDVVAWAGALTALGAASIAVAQNDIKKVLAYSTISQLGFMVAAAGLGAYVAAMFHLMTHAFFKALLFLASGSVILALERGAHHAHDHHTDPQDMRFMGGLWGRLPVTRWLYFIGAVALMGLPPLAGFFSKDEILLDAFKHNLGIYGVLSVAAFLTAFYMTRQLWMVFGGSARSQAAAHATDSPAIITLPLAGLAVFSVVAGAFNLPKFAGVTYGAELAFKNFLKYSLAEVEAVNFDWVVAGVSTALAVLAIGLGTALYRRAYATAQAADPLARLGGLWTALSRKWYVDELYQAVFVYPYRQLAMLTAKALDAGGVDAIVNGVGEFTYFVSRGLGQLESGYARRYALIMFLGVVLVLSVFLIAQ